MSEKTGLDGEGEVRANTILTAAVCSAPTTPGPEIGAPHLAPHSTLTAAPQHMRYYPLMNLEAEAQRRKSLAQGLTARKQGGAYIKRKPSARKGPQALTTGKEMATWTPCQLGIPSTPLGNPFHPSWS